MYCDLNVTEPGTFETPRGLGALAGIRCWKFSVESKGSFTPNIHYVFSCRGHQDIQKKHNTSCFGFCNLDSKKNL